MLCDAAANPRGGNERRGSGFDAGETRKPAARRRFLGVRLWLADVAPGLRLFGERAGPRSGLSPLAVHFLACAPRHAGAARASAGLGSRRLLPGRGLPGRGEFTRGDLGLPARTRARDLGLSGKDPDRRVFRRRPGLGAGLCGRPRASAIRRAPAGRGNHPPRLGRARRLRRQSRLCAQHIRASAAARHPRRRAGGGDARARRLLVPGGGVAGGGVGGALRPSHSNSARLNLPS